jgi:hypothetical protein
MKVLIATILLLLPLLSMTGSSNSNYEQPIPDIVTQFEVEQVRRVNSVTLQKITEEVYKQVDTTYVSER